MYIHPTCAITFKFLAVVAPVDGSVDAAKSINLFAIKGHRPLSHHMNSTDINYQKKDVKLYKLGRYSSIHTMSVRKIFTCHFCQLLPAGQMLFLSPNQEFQHTKGNLSPQDLTVNAGKKDIVNDSATLSGPVFPQQINLPLI